jgi:hypothetical protein
MNQRSLPLFVLLLLAASAFAGERVARQGDDEVHVFDSPCVSAQTIARIPENAREGWGKVQGRYQGERFFGCWLPMGDDAIFILWEDGDQGVIPAADLKPALTI